MSNNTTNTQPAVESSAAQGTIWSRIRTWVVGLTGVLVVVPALINSGVDVYQKINDIPQSEAERVNKQLFQDYFGKEPVWNANLPIKAEFGTVSVLFSVYSGGDVLVEMGDRKQWFPLKLNEPKSPASKRAQLDLIGSAHAQSKTELNTLPSRSLNGTGSYSQRDAFEDGKLVRQREWENGVRDREEINPTTGRVLKSSQERITKAPTPPSSTPAPNRPVTPSAATPSAASSKAIGGFAPIDLESLRNSQSKSPVVSNTAVMVSACVSSEGVCTLLKPQTMGSACSCYDGENYYAGKAQKLLR